MLSFHLYTEAVRKNNSERILAAQVSICPLLYASHHPKYQLLHLRDLVQRVLYPSEISDYMKQNETFSRSGKQNRAQGADFIHEEIPNRLVKSFLGPGMPTKDIWINICRKATLLKEMKENVIAKSGLSQSSDTDKRHLKYDLETTMIRKEIRSVRYLSTPWESENLVSIEGMPLDLSLCDFKHTAKENYDYYKDHFRKTGNYGGIKLTPLFLTSEERDVFFSIESKTKAEIATEIENILSKMPDKIKSSELSAIFKKKSKGFKHCEFISRYYEYLHLLTEQEAEISETSTENDKSMYQN